MPTVRCITTAVRYRRPSQSFAYRFGPCPTSERNALWDTRRADLGETKETGGRGVSGWTKSISVGNSWEENAKKKKKAIIPRHRDIICQNSVCFKCLSCYLRATFQMYEIGMNILSQKV